MIVIRLEVAHVKSGVVMVEDEPYYYVDMVDGDVGKMIIAYEIDPKSIEEYRKIGTPDPALLYKKKKIESATKYHYFINRKTGEGLTKLAQKAIKRDPKASEKVTKILYKPAIFISPVIKATDSFDDNYTDCFAEMVPTELRGPQNGTYIKMEPTGVKIGLQHIFWTTDTYQLGDWEGYSSMLYENYASIFSQPDDQSLGMINIDH